MRHRRTAKCFFEAALLKRAANALEQPAPNIRTAAPPTLTATTTGLYLDTTALASLNCYSFCDSHGAVREKLRGTVAN